MTFRRVLITRAAEDIGELLFALERRGFVGVPLPMLEYGPGPDEPILPKEGWLVITSPRAAARLHQGAVPLQIRIAVVGERTALEVRKRGYPVACVAANSAQSLGELLADDPGPFLWWCGDRALPDLARALRSRSRVLRTACVYRTILRKVARAEWESAINGLAAMIFLSPSSVTAFVDQADPLWLREKGQNLLVVTGGPTTAAELAKRGFRRVVCASSPATDDLAQAVGDGLQRPLC